MDQGGNGRFGDAGDGGREDGGKLSAGDPREGRAPVGAIYSVVTFESWRPEVWRLGDGGYYRWDGDGCLWRGEDTAELARTLAEALDYFECRAVEDVLDALLTLGEAGLARSLGTFGHGETPARHPSNIRRLPVVKTGTTAGEGGAAGGRGAGGGAPADVIPMAAARRGAGR